MSASSSPVPTPKRIVGTPRAPTASSTRRVAGRTKRSYSAGEREPAQLSKSWTAAAPAPTWARRKATAIVRQPVDEARPRSRVGVHERLHLGEVARRPALDQVAGHGERRAGEPDQRHLGGQLPGQEPHRLEHVSRVGLGVERPQPLEVGGRAERPFDDRASARHDVDAEPDRADRHDDVGEQDGGVDPVAADRLQRDLGRQLGVGDGLEDAAGPAQARGTRAATGRPGA